MKIKLTLLLRFIVAHAYKRTIKVSFIFMGQNKADPQVQLYFGK